MQASWGAEILDNAKQFNTLFSLHSVCTTEKYRLDAASCGKCDQMPHSFLHAEVHRAWEALSLPKGLWGWKSLGPQCLLYPRHRTVWSYLPPGLWVCTPEIPPLCPSASAAVVLFQTAPKAGWHPLIWTANNASWARVSPGPQRLAEAATPSRSDSQLAQHISAWGWNKHVLSAPLFPARGDWGERPRLAQGLMQSC